MLPPVAPTCERAILYASFVVERSRGLSDCAPRAGISVASDLCSCYVTFLFETDITTLRGHI